MPLDWSLFVKNIRPEPHLRTRISNHVEKLREEIESRPADPLKLKIRLEKHPKKRWYLAVFSLKAGQVIISARAFSADLDDASAQAAKGLRKELLVSPSPYPAPRTQAAW